MAKKKAVKKVPKKVAKKSVKTTRKPPVKLTDAKVVAIRTAYAKGNVTYVQLGEKYGISNTTVSHIVNGKAYPKAGGPISTMTKSEKMATVSARIKGTDLDRLKKMRQRGKTIAEMAEHFGVCTGTISKYMRRFGMT